MPVLYQIILAAAALAVSGCALKTFCRPSAPSLSTRMMVRCAMVAAIYTAVCLLLAPFSYGAIQVRVAEALCLLPVFGPEYIVGVTLGCFLSNMLGSGPIDMVLGTAATLLACLCTYKARSHRIKGLALLPAFFPVLFNALIVGPEISIFFSDVPATPLLIAYNSFTVAIGEVISCMVIGTALVKVIEANPALRGLFAGEQSVC